jgi:ubiquinone/menaquinone biosynthesis C-methylase UbiE
MAELASTYFVQDRNSQEELGRLILQDRMTTTVMGGVLPEQGDPSKFRRVLDIGCGPGGWLLEVAQAYPQIEKLYGIDISSMIIHHARQQAEQQNMMTGPKERVEFLSMDALLVLEFPHDFFDLVNFRFGVSFMRQWDWPKMLSEMNRVTRTGGIVRIVDGETNVLFSESKALSQFYELMTRALFRAGHLFKEERSGLIDELPGLLVRSGFQKIETRESVIEYRAGTELGDTWIKDVMYMFRTFRPFLHRYGCDPKDCDEICKQATQDMQQPGFTASYRLVTTWATNPKGTNAMNVSWF